MAEFVGWNSLRWTALADYAKSLRFSLRLHQISAFLGTTVCTLIFLTLPKGLLCVDLCAQTQQPNPLHTCPTLLADIPREQTFTPGSVYEAFITVAVMAAPHCSRYMLTQATNSSELSSLMEPRQKPRILCPLHIFKQRCDFLWFALHPTGTPQSPAHLPACNTEQQAWDPVSHHTGTVAGGCDLAPCPPSPGLARTVWGCSQVIGD